MTSNDFFTAVDVLEYLKTEQAETIQKLTDLNDEIFAVIGDLEELILQGDMELLDDEDKSYFVNLRIFSGFNPENRKRAEKILAQAGITVDCVSHI